LNLPNFFSVKTQLEHEKSRKQNWQQNDFGHLQSDCLVSYNHETLLHCSAIQRLHWSVVVNYFIGGIHFEAT